MTEGEGRQGDASVATQAWQRERGNASVAAQRNGDKGQGDTSVVARQRRTWGRERSGGERRSGATRSYLK